MTACCSAIRNSCPYKGVEVVVKTATGKTDGATKIAKAVRDTFKLLSHINLVAGYDSFVSALGIFANFGEFFDAWKRLFAVIQGNDDGILGWINAIFFATYRTGNALKLLDKLNVINLSYITDAIGSIPFLNKLPIIDTAGGIAATADIAIQALNIGYRYDDELNRVNAAKVLADTMQQVYEERETLSTEKELKLKQKYIDAGFNHLKAKIALGKTEGMRDLDTNAKIRAHVEDKWRVFRQAVDKLTAEQMKYAESQLTFQARCLTLLAERSAVDYDININKSFISIISNVAKVALVVLIVIGAFTGIPALTFPSVIMFSFLWLSSMTSLVKVLYDTANPGFGKPSMKAFEALTPLTVLKFQKDARKESAEATAKALDTLGAGATTEQKAAAAKIISEDEQLISAMTVAL